MPRWSPRSWTERARQSREAKREMVGRLRPQAEPDRDPWWQNLEQVPVVYTSDWGASAAYNVWPSTTVTASDNSTWHYNTYNAYDTTATASISYQQMVQYWQEHLYRRQQERDLWRYPEQYTVSFNAWETNAGEPLTQEEADRRLAATRAEAHKSAIRRKKAVKKGRKLLLEVLTEAQQAEYARTKSFTVQGADGKIYKLRKGGTTHQIDESGLAVLSHCIHLPYSYIDEDTLIAVKLMLETDPATFLKIANTSTLMARSGIVVPSVPQDMADRIAALAGGLEGVNERFRRLGEAATAARGAAAHLGRAFEDTNEVIRDSIDVEQARIDNAAIYGDYARELEQQVVVETVGPVVLPPAVRQQHAARELGHTEDIAGVPVAA